MYFQHLHALNSTGISQVLLHKSPCVLTKDGVTSAIPARCISNDANDGNSMKTVGVHIVTTLFCVCGRGWVKTYSQFIAVYRSLSQSAPIPSNPRHHWIPSRFLPVAIVCDDIRDRNAELSPAKQGQKAVKPSNKGRSIALHWQQQIRIEIPAQ